MEVASVLAILLMLGLDFAADVKDRDFTSWLDPQMYYRSATDIRRGHRATDSLLIPTIYPLLMAPFASSIGAALWLNFVLLTACGAAIAMLRRPLGIDAPLALVLLVMLSAPLVVGLSRTLYCETLLLAALMLTFACWVRSEQFTRPVWTASCAGLLGLALASKTTALLFLAGPLLLQVLALTRARQWRGVVMFGGVIAVAVAITAAIHAAWLQPSLAYYRRMGGAQDWAMRLIGPESAAHWTVGLYYPVQLVKAGLMGAAVFLPLGLLAFRPAVSRGTHSALRLHAAMLAAWLLLPLLVLTIVPMKESRHILACVAPAVLLIFMGLSRLRSLPLRSAAMAAIALIAIAQYFLVTRGYAAAAYFIDHPMARDAIIAQLLQVDPTVQRRAAACDSGDCRESVLQHWAYGTNIALTGFDPAEAFAIAWQLAPAIVYDLDQMETDDADASRLPFQRFEDLFSYTHFNLYNRRLGWRRQYVTLPSQQIHQHANIILVRTRDGRNVLSQFPDHIVAGSVTRDRDVIVVLRRKSASTVPYRILYARAYLRELTARAQVDTIELNTICYEWVKTLALSRHEMDAPAILSEFPAGFRPGDQRRRIYWLGGWVWTSQALYDQAYAQLTRAAAAPRRVAAFDRGNR